MSCYSLISRMLSDKFLVKDNRMEEKGTQTVTICNKNGQRVHDYSLYRFDSSKSDFLPFFNNSRQAPSRLRSFCDYILSVEFRGKHFLLLIELKSGKSTEAQYQLEAAECFVNYIITSAKRIKDFNDEALSDFDSVIVKKITVKKGIVRPTTKPNQQTDIQLVDNDRIIYRTDKFDLERICRFCQEKQAHTK